MLPPDITNLIVQQQQRQYSSSGTGQAAHNGLFVGYVKKLEGDPLRQGRILVVTSYGQSEKLETWVSMAGTSGSHRGFYKSPEVGDSLICGSIDSGVAIALAYHSEHWKDGKSPVEKNGHKADHENWVITGSDGKSPKGLVKFDKDGTVSLSDCDGSYSFSISDAGVEIKSKGNVYLQAGSDATLSSSTIELKAQESITMDSGKATSVSSAVSVISVAPGFQAKGIAMGSPTAPSADAPKPGTVPKQYDPDNPPKV